MSPAANRRPYLRIRDAAPTFVAHALRKPGPVAACYLAATPGVSGSEESGVAARVQPVVDETMRSLCLLVDKKRKSCGEAQAVSADT